MQKAQNCTGTWMNSRPCLELTPTSQNTQTHHCFTSKCWVKKISTALLGDLPHVKSSPKFAEGKAASSNSKLKRTADHCKIMCGGQTEHFMGQGGYCELLFCPKPQLKLMG